MKIVGYCRVSTDKKDQINSLKAQKGFFKSFAEKKGYELVDIYADEGIGGTTIKKRKELQRLLNDSETEAFEMILIKDISRLARNTEELLSIIKTFNKNKKKVYFLSYNMDAQELSDFNITLLGAVAQQESHNTSVRVKASKKANAEKGKVPNFCYGYNKTKGELFKLDINEEESKIVKEIFDMYVDRKYGAGKIAIALNKKGLRTKRGNKWSQNAITRILRNEIYVGKVINNKEKVEDYLTGERVENPKKEWNIIYNEDLRIIDDKTFSNAQDILKDRYYKFGNDRKRKKVSNKYIFSTLIKCKHCGYSYRRMHRKYESGNEYIYWACSGRNANGVDSCPNDTTVDEQDLIVALGEIFIQVMSSKDNYIEGIKAEFRKLYDRNNEITFDFKESKNELKKLERDLKKENDLYRADQITMEQLIKNSKPIKFKIEAKKEEILMLEQKITVEDRVDDILNNTFNDISTMLDVNKVNNADLKRVIEKIEVDKDRNVVIWFKILGRVGVKGSVHNSDIST